MSRNLCRKRCVPRAADIGSPFLRANCPPSSCCMDNNALVGTPSVRVGVHTMADNRSPESRSALMARIGGKDTAPEMVVRRLLHALGYRFRLHRRNLPGTPDIVFPARRKVVFVNGCFWHAHGCRIGQPPKSRREFWGPKLVRNRSKDARNRRALRRQGWGVLTVWQCQTRSAERLEIQLRSYLGPPGEIPIDKHIWNR